MFNSAVLVSALAILASALPTNTNPATSVLSYPPKTSSATFELVANDTSSPPSLNLTLFSVISLHVGAGQAHAVLLPPNKAVSGREFYVNGTATDVRYDTGNILGDAGSSPDTFPEGIIVSSTADAEGRYPIEVNAGSGTTGVAITQFPDPFSRLEYGGYGFYGCNTTIVNEEAIQLFARPPNTVTPAGCDEVTLFPQCTGAFTANASRPYAQNVSCYANVQDFLPGVFPVKV